MRRFERQKILDCARATEITNGDFSRFIRVSLQQALELRVALSTSLSWGRSDSSSEKSRTFYLLTLDLELRQAL